MLHLRSFTWFSMPLECWNAFRFGQTNKFWKKSLDIQVRVLSRSSRRRPENVLETSRINLPGTSFRLPLKVWLKSPLDVISGRPQDVRLGRPWDRQIGSLGDVLGTCEGDVLGTSWGPIFAGWDVANR